MITLKLAFYRFRQLIVTLHLVLKCFVYALVLYTHPVDCLVSRPGAPKNPKLLLLRKNFIRVGLVRLELTSPG
jgi:hypothetical protein